MRLHLRFNRFTYYPTTVLESLQAAQHNLADQLVDLKSCTFNIELRRIKWSSSLHERGFKWLCSELSLPNAKSLDNTLDYWKNCTSHRTELPVKRYYSSDADGVFRLHFKFTTASGRSKNSHSLEWRSLSWTAFPAVKQNWSEAFVELHWVCPPHGSPAREAHLTAFSFIDSSKKARQS